MPELTTLGDILVALGLGVALLGTLGILALATYLLYLAEKQGAPWF